MPIYSYKVRDNNGKTISGTMEADGQQNVIGRLRQPGYIVLSVTAQKGGAANNDIFASFKKVTKKELTIFSRQFSTMIDAGLPLTKCLNILYQQTPNPKFKKIIDELQHDISSGLTLSASLAKHPEVFPNLYVSTIKAGEAGGVLDDVLSKLAEHLEKEDNIRAKIKGAMTYPIGAMTFTVLIVVVMITFIVPIFTKIFADLGGELPTPTKILIMLSSFFRSYWYVLIGLLILSIFVGKKLKDVEDIRRWLDATKLKLPIVGILIRKTAVSNFTRTLGTLIVSGVPILAALEIVEDTAGNTVIADAIDRVRTSIKEGETIAKPLESSGIFPPMVIQMIAVGEETGALDAMLQKVSDFYDSEVDVAVDSLTSMIEPLLMIFMGLAVTGIMLSLYLPMFKMSSLIK